MPNKNVYFEQPLRVKIEGGIYPDSNYVSGLACPGIIIPFATGASATSTATGNTGVTTSITIASSGHTSSAITLTDMSFNLISSNFHAFIMPYEAVLETIYLTVNSPGVTLPAGGEFYPYVIVAVADANSQTFQLLLETKTRVDMPYSGTVTANTLRSGSLDQLNVAIHAGQRVAIVCAFEATGVTATQSRTFYYSGSLLLK